MGFWGAVAICVVVWILVVTYAAVIAFDGDDARAIREYERQKAEFERMFE